MNSNDIDFFFGHQLTAKNSRYKIYQQSTVETLLNAKSIFHCHIVSTRDGQQVIAKFELNSSPRERSHWCALFVPQPNISKTYSHLLDQQAIGYSDFNIIKCWKNNEEASFLICEVLDQDFFHAISKGIEAGRSPTLWIAERMPPLDDLLNTRNFMISYPKCELKQYLNTQESAWSPKPINSHHLKEHLSQTQSNLVAIQGPPGTGKSYLVAELVVNALTQNRSVAVVTMSNRALMEVALKPVLKSHITNGKVYKTALSSREKRECPRLLSAQELMPIPGKLLMMTVYQATKVFTTRFKFDLLILDEASQVFLPMILGLKKLTHQFFIIGDPAQLPPITESHPQFGNLSIDYNPLIFGIESITRGVEKSEQFILNETYRLLPKTASLTSLFYPSTLISLQKESSESPILNIPINSGVHLVDVSDMPSIFEYVDKLVHEFLYKRSKGTLAIISPFIEDVSKLQQKLANYSSNRLLVETIDRIQGLTVDLCLFVIFRESEFVYNLNRFNVATSRSRGLTIILRQKNDFFNIPKPTEVTHYLELLESSVNHIIK